MIKIEQHLCAQCRKHKSRLQVEFIPVHPDLNKEKYKKLIMLKALKQFKRKSDDQETFSQSEENTASLSVWQRGRCMCVITVSLDSEWISAYFSVVDEKKDLLRKIKSVFKGNFYLSAVLFQVS